VTLPRCSWVLLPLAGLLASTPADYQAVQRKFDSIQSGRLRPGVRVELTAAELNAYAEHNLPAGVRDPRLQITGPGIATGSAVVDFNKLGQATGHPPGFLMSMLLGGEKPVRVTARIQSSGGEAIVDLQSVQVSGLEVSGPALDFLIRNVLLPLFPDAVVGRPFELGRHISALDVQPRAVGVVIGR